MSLPTPSTRHLQMDIAGNSRQTTDGPIDGDLHATELR